LTSNRFRAAQQRLLSVRCGAGGAEARAGKVSDAQANYKAAIATLRELDLPLPLVLTLLEREAFLRPTAAGRTGALKLIDRLGAAGLNGLVRDRS
jgi:hypothetical protein